jgi:hypothetical protein
MLRILCLAATAGLAAILMTSGPAAADSPGYGGGFGYGNGYGYGPSHGYRARSRHWRRMQRRRMHRMQRRRMYRRYGPPRVRVYNNYYNRRPYVQRRVVNNYYGYGRQYGYRPAPRRAYRRAPVYRRNCGGGNQLVGGLLGGATGGFIGNQIGSGRGNMIATAAGALIGIVAGSTIGRANDMRNCY